jgi:Helix-turn-helix domain
MSIKVMTWAFDQPLAGNEKVVLLAMADFCDDDGMCWPSIGKIARKAYISERTVQRILLELADQEYLSFVSRSDDGGRSLSKKYQLIMYREGDSLSPMGDKGDTHEGDNCVTPHKGTVIKNRQYIMSVSSETDTKPKKPVSSSKPSYSESFKEFWAAYPVDQNPNMSKAEAFKNWQKLDAEDHVSAIKAIKPFKAHVSKQRDYVMLHAATYLSQRRFDGFVKDQDQFKTRDNWIKTLGSARNLKTWSTKSNGPFPNTPGCLVPHDLILQDDGIGWVEFSKRKKEWA